MANEKNLRTPSTEEARDMQRKSAKKRSENIKRRKAFKDVFISILSTSAGPFLVDNEERQKLAADAGMTVNELLALAQIAKAAKGDTAAFTVIRDTVGEKPGEKLALEKVPEIKIKIEEM